MAAAVLCCLGILVLSRMRARALSDLCQVLYDQGDAELYLELLENPRLRLLFSRRALVALRLEGDRVRRSTPQQQGRKTRHG